ncbi:MAG: arylsulfatase [Bacteroidota bacterium]
MKNLFFVSLIFLLLSSCEKPTEEKKANKPPNIVLILTDDQGWGDLSINGNRNLSTPNIDALAKNGVAFDRFYVSPVCSPTRAEILTGRYAVRSGVYSTSAGGERIDLDEVTIADYLKENNYNTACYGKWHSGMQYPYHPNGRGFDDYYGFCSGHWGNYFSPMLERNGEIVKGEGFIIDDFTDKAVSFIEENKENPFFLYLPYNTPHSPMQVPDKWWDKFKDKELVDLHRDPAEEDLVFTRAALALCENIDWNVGKVMETLRAQGLEENTIVIYLSDNGPNSYRWNDGMKGRKGSTDEGGVRSPLIMQWKGKFEGGKKINQIASSLDLLPTLTDFAEMQSQYKKPLDGKSLKPLLLEESPDWQERAIVSHWKGKTSVRNQQYRLDHENHLFDMLADPGQKVDISEQNPAILQALLATKTNWENNVLVELPEEDLRTFPIGHPDYVHYQIPARDGIAHGTIQRSNRWPNCSYFTNWTSTKDEITWDVEVQEDADYEVTIYYTCSPENVGGKMTLNFMDTELAFEISEAFDSPFLGKEYDRYKRGESFIKDFKPLNIGKIHLQKGEGILTLKALEIPGEEAIDFRLLMLKKLG